MRPRRFAAAASIQEASRAATRLLACVLCCSAPWLSGCSSYDWKHRVLYAKNGAILYAEYQERDGEKVPQGFLHPVHLTSETVTAVLRQMAYRYSPLIGKNADLRLFDDGQVANLAEPLRDALGNLTPNERLRFLVMRDRWASAITGAKATSGVLFVKDEGVLNIAVDLIREGIAIGEGGNPEDVSFEYEPTEYRRDDPLIPFRGSRLHLDPEANQRFPRWLEVELAGIEPPPPQVSEATPAATAAAPSNGSTVKEDGTPSAATAAPPPAAESEEERYSRLKEKLETLKRLKAEGVVTEEEYQEQFDKIMSEL